MTSAPLFGMLILDREPFRFADLGGLAQAWLQDGGAFVFPGLVFYIVYALLTTGDKGRSRTNLPMVTLVASAAAFLLYATYFAMFMKDYGGDPDEMTRKATYDPTSFSKYIAPRIQTYWQAIVLTAAGFCTMLAAFTPFVLGMMKVKGRRVFALARLTVQEVIRNRVFLVLFLVFVPVLFPIKWFLPFKAEDELRVTVKVTLFGLSAILIMMSSLLASFAMPNDVKNQNIYTIITKPVVPFEILLGRFLGYVFIATVSLVFLLGVSWALIEFSGNLSEEAKAETFKARVPVRGKLRFASKRGENIEGIDAGREFNYRKYIAGDPKSSQRAVYMFDDLPSGLKKMTDDAVPVEFTFDIFRLTKGVENRGVDVKIRVVTWQCEQVAPQITATGTGEWTWKSNDPGRDPEREYLDDARKLLAQKLGGNPDDPRYRDPISSMTAAMLDLSENPNGKPSHWPEGKAWPPKEWEVANELAEKYGFFEIGTKEVYDMHPEKVIIPSAIFRNADSKPQPDRTDANGKPLPKLPAVSIYVKCTSSSQLLGTAEGDLYILETEQAFWQNYWKAGFGLWCWIVLIIGISCCLSTYLAGVVTLLAGIVIFLGGFAQTFLIEMGSGKATVGGPFTSLNQLLQGKQSTTPDDGTATARAADFGDKGFGYIVRRIVNFLPDVDGYNWMPYIAEGFNIPIEGLIMNFVTLVAYLGPWFLLGFYLIRSREVAA